MIQMEELPEYKKTILEDNEMDNKDKVLEALKNAGKELRPGEIAELAGITKDEADKAISALKKEEKIFSPKRCFYDIKK